MFFSTIVGILIYFGREYRLIVFVQYPLLSLLIVPSLFK